jgi:hypothetical protein
MGKACSGLRNIQKDEDYHRRKKFEAAKTKILKDESVKLFDANGRLIIRKTNQEKKIRKRGTKVMKKIKCTKCGAEKGISRKRLERNLKKFGTESALTAKYVCRSCKAKDKPVKEKTEAKKAAPGKKTATEILAEEKKKDPKKAAKIEKMASNGKPDTKSK